MGMSWKEQAAQGSYAEAVGEGMRGAEARSRESFAKAEAWARQHLPDEFAPFAASAALSLKLGRGTVTAERVRERLKAQGRDATTNSIRIRQGRA